MRVKQVTSQKRPGKNMAKCKQAHLKSVTHEETETQAEQQINTYTDAHNTIIIHVPH